MSHAQRSSADNGIWLCETHAKLIDTDTLRFPSHFLHRWKRQLRHLTQRAQANGHHTVQQSELIRGLRRQSVGLFSDDELADFIGDFLEDIGCTFVWGQAPTEGGRQVLTELLLNDVQHGGATWARVESRGFALKLVTDGDHFSINDLLASPVLSGGHATVKAFRASYRDTHVLSHSSAAKRNAYLITDIRQAPRAHNPCSATAWDFEAPSSPAVLAKLEDCPEVHLYLRERRWTISGGTRRLRRMAIPTTTTVVLHNVTSGVMANAMMELNSHLSLRIAGQRPSEES